MLAVWNPDGTRGAAFVLEPAGRFLVPAPGTPLSVYPLRGPLEMQRIPACGGWTDITPSTTSGSMLMHVPETGRAILYLADAAPLESRLLDTSSTALEFRITSYGRHDTSLAKRLAADEFEWSFPDDADHVSRIELSRLAPSDQTAALIALGGLPLEGWVRLDGAGSPGAAFPVNTVGLLHLPDEVSEVLLMHRDDQAQLTGAGWSGVETDGVTALRWMMARLRGWCFRSIVHGPEG